MKLKLFTAIAVLAGLATASGTPEEEEGRKHRDHPGIKQLIEKFDKDGDGKLSPEERKAAGAARKAEFLKKFDKEIESLWDNLYKIKELLEDTGDYELSELGGKFLDQIADGLEEGDISVENIRDQITG